MKKNIGIMVGMAVLIPVMSMADVTVKAYAQDGAIAYVYAQANPTVVASQATFSGGTATISTAGLSGNYGLAMSYKPGGAGAWYSNIAWANGANGAQFRNLSAGTTLTINDAITGEVTSRSLAGANASVTFAANGAVGQIGSYDNDINSLDAQLGLYRPVRTKNEYDNGVTITKTWNSGNLGAGYGLTVSTWAADPTLNLLTVTNTAGDYITEYVGNDQGGGIYDLSFLSLAKVTSVFGSGTIVSNNSSVTFSAPLGTGTYDDVTPYYVLMDAAWIFDDAANNGNYSETYDQGMVLTSPDYYNIPEPSVIVLLMGSGGALLAIRRFFLI